MDVCGSKSTAIESGYPQTVILSLSQVWVMVLWVMVLSAKKWQMASFLVADGPFLLQDYF